MHQVQSSPLKFIGKHNIAFLALPGIILGKLNHKGWAAPHAKYSQVSLKYASRTGKLIAIYLQFQLNSSPFPIQFNSNSLIVPVQFNSVINK